MLKNIDEELSNFIARQNEYVLCLSGRWGVGKTYAWRTARQKHPVAPDGKYQGYSYVSLFGIESLADLRSAIFTNKQTADLTDDAVINEAIGYVKKAIRQVLTESPKLPFAKN